MNYGKRICETLKELRRRIIEANGLPPQLEECHHEGPCPGTCPRCEAELRYLQRNIEYLERKGHSVNLEGLMDEAELLKALASVKPYEDESEATPRLPDELWPFINRNNVDADPSIDEPEALMGDIAEPDDDEDYYRLPGVDMILPSTKDIPETLLNLLLEDNPNGNIVFSPLGVIAMLRLLQMGTNPHSEVGQMMCSYLRDFRGEWPKGSETFKVTLEHAVSLWMNKNFGYPKEKFLCEAKENLSAEAHTLDFGNSESAKETIDDWVNRASHGLIPRLDCKITPETYLMLIDAIYFKARWRQTFDEELTQPRVFLNADESRVKVDMMRIEISQANYRETDEYQKVDLYYQGKEFFMTILLPKDDWEVEDVMSDYEWEYTTRPTLPCMVDLSLPKFKVESSVNLQRFLREWELDDIFDRDDVLTEITDEPIHVSEIAQQCSLSIDEKGTEAASITRVTKKLGCLPEQPPLPEHKMVVNRPFGFAIRHISGAVLFMGVINHLDGESVKPSQRGKYLTTITVAGTSYVKNMKDLAPEIFKGVELVLRLEPENKHDRNAIGLYLGDDRVGYVPRTQNQIIGNLIKADVPLVAVVSGAEWHDGWLRIEANIMVV